MHEITPRILLAGTALALLMSLPTGEAAAKTEESAKSADDLLVVDCLLPQKVRRLGRNNTYLAPRRPIRTTAVDCRIRGGEYTQPDQASFATSLEVWLPRAKGGDAEAQYFVGQIFERGLGTSPDHAAAAEWYRKAAEQGYSAAMVDLGYFYEKGLGVEADEVAALNWYRRAAGLAEDLVVLEAQEYDALVEAREALDGKISEVEALQGEIEELRRQLSAAEEAGDMEQKRQATLQSILTRLEADLASRQREVNEGRGRIASLEKQLETVAEKGGGATAAGSASLGEIPFGSYHALVIGNSEYRNLPKLAAAADARQVADLLEKKYGFTVRLMLDADRFQIMNALNQLREQLTEEDNLLIYYAGHGERDAEGQTAYWQPIDAAPDNPANWIPSGVVTEHLDLIAANHVFVVADSVYSGLRTRSSVARLPRGMTDEERYFHIKLLLEKRARLVLSSGGFAAARGGAAADPSDSGGSTFVSAFLQVLRRNDGVLEASRLYTALNEQLFESNRNSSNLEFATMKWARNDLADFFFVPSDLR
ncbi:MAG: caspase family protein [Acidobacteriota bacterium]